MPTAGHEQTDRPEKIFYTSPCQRARVAHGPNSFHGGWTIAYATDPRGVPDWIATLSRDTPTEITAHIIDTLVHDLATNRTAFLPGGDHYPPTSPTTVMARQGWSPEETGRYRHHRSPSGLARFSIRTFDLDPYTELCGDGPATWQLYASTATPSGAVWYADFTAHTPIHLLGAATEAASSTVPVRRTLEQLHPAALSDLFVNWATDDSSLRADAARARSTTGIDQLAAGRAAVTEALAATHRPSDSPPVDRRSHR